MSTIFKQWLFIVSSSVLFVLSDSLAANWARTGNIYSLVVVIFVAPVGYLLFGELNKIKSLSVSSGLVNMFMILGNVVVGLLFFKDALSIKQAFGLFFAVIAVILMA